MAPRPQARLPADRKRNIFAAARLILDKAGCRSMAAMRPRTAEDSPKRNGPLPPHNIIRPPRLARRRTRMCALSIATRRREVVCDETGTDSIISGAWKAPTPGIQIKSASSTHGAEAKINSYNKHQFQSRSMRWMGGQARRGGRRGEGQRQAHKYDTFLESA